MKTIVKEVLGFEVEYTNIPESLAEAVSQAGNEQEVLDCYVDQVVFHTQNGIARSAIVKALSEKLGVKPMTETVEGKEKVIETPQQFVNRLRAELGDEVVDAQASGLRHIAPTIDWTPAARGGGSTNRVAAKWLAAVDQLIEAGKYERFIAKYGIDASLPAELLKPTVALKLKQVVEAAAAEQLKLATAV